jgi:hypothetical protein
MPDGLVRCTYTRRFPYATLGSSGRRVGRQCFPEKEVGVKRTIVFIITALMLAISMAGPAAAGGINWVDTGCSNPAGHWPAGQQPTCNGAGLDQHGEYQNPAGKAPPGQNK